METTLPVFNSPCPQQGNAVKDFIAERRKPSGEFTTLTHRRARALPLQTQCYCGENSSQRDHSMPVLYSPRCIGVHPPSATFAGHDSSVGHSAPS